MSDQAFRQHLELGPRDSRRSSKGAKMWQRDVSLGPGLPPGWRVSLASGLRGVQAYVLALQAAAPSLLGSQAMPLGPSSAWGE